MINCILFFSGEEERYDKLLYLFNNIKIEPTNFSSTDILNIFSFICKNEDHILSSNIDVLEKDNSFAYKERVFYNYVLLKKSVLGNLRKIGSKSIDTKLDVFAIFLEFVRSIYYIGKATGRRDLDHIREAIDIVMNDTTKSVEEDGKLHTCMKELLEEEGVVIVTGFQDSSNYMAHNREAAMMDWVGLENLTNIRKGSYYGETEEWNTIKKKNYGMMVLFSLFKNYLNDGAIGLQFDSLFYNQKRAKEQIKEEVCCNHNHVCCIKCNKII